MVELTESINDGPTGFDAICGPVRRGIGEDEGACDDWTHFGGRQLQAESSKLRSQLRCPSCSTTLRRDNAQIAGSRRVVVLDDDPGGLQASQDVAVLLDPTACPGPLLTSHDALHIITNTRALSRNAASILVANIADHVQTAASQLGCSVEFVLRGDTTLRGHVIAEADAMDPAHSVLLFVPAYPDLGRRTVHGQHLVDIGDVTLNVADTEFAADPAFAFKSRNMTDWVTEHLTAIGCPSRPVRNVSLAGLRRGQLAEVLVNAEAGAVVIPDVATSEDLLAVSAAVDRALARGARLVVRGSGALAALRTGHLAARTVTPEQQRDHLSSVLIVCGSHTQLTTGQLQAVAEANHVPIRTIKTAAALSDPSAVATASSACVADLRLHGLAILASERLRPVEHSDRAVGQAVMTALQKAVRQIVLQDCPLTAVVAKGGITAAATARLGLGASVGTVRGPLLPGVGLWRLTDCTGRQLDYVVAPGNIGPTSVLCEIASFFAVPVAREHTGFGTAATSE